MKNMAYIWMGALALALALALPGAARADNQARLNVVAHALAAYENPDIKTLAITGFSSLGDGRRPPVSQKLEDGLRSALQKQGKARQVLEAGRDPQDADGLVTGTFSLQDGQLRVHVVLSDESGTALWTRDCLLDASAYPADDFGVSTAAPAKPAASSPPPRAGAPESGQVVPSLPADAEPYPYGWTSPRRFWGSYHMDMSAGYKAFFPLNTSLQSAAGSQFNGFKLGLSFDDVFLLDYDYWNQSVSSQGTVTGLEYIGTQMALVYPWHLGNHWVLYLGPGGRFGEIRVDDSALSSDFAVFGNNGFIVLAGAKARLGQAGLDLRYTYDLAYSYTGYHTLSLGAFYEFGY